MTSIPTYQEGVMNAVNLGSTQFRNVPDVAMVASNEWLFYNDGQQGLFGGTSLASPLWAGFMALVNEQNASAGLHSIGFANPAIYAIAQSSLYDVYFHDISDGTSNANVSTPPGTPNFTTIVGYDLVTGWGSPQCALIDQLACATTCGTASCVDLDSNNNHCGVCGNVCGDGRQCYAGQCAACGNVTVGITGVADGPQICVTGSGCVAGDSVTVSIQNPPGGGSATGTVGGMGDFAYWDLTQVYSQSCTQPQIDGTESVFVVVTDVDTGLSNPPVAVPSSYFCIQSGFFSPPFGPGGLSCNGFLSFD
jgi:hypothetical protein